MESFEIVLFKDSIGNSVELDKLTLAASKSVRDIFDALINIAEYEKKKNNLDLKIALDNCCAAHKLYGEESSMKIVFSNILNVTNDLQERDNHYVYQLNVIHRVLAVNETAEIKITQKGKVFDLKEKFNKPFRIKRKRSNTVNDFKIDFIKGRLQQNGGKKPNFHLETSHDQEITISCNESEAIKVNKFLYKEIYIAAWSKSNGQKMSYSFADLYLDNDQTYYNDFKSFFNDLEKAENTAPYHLISKKIKSYYDILDFISAKKFIRLFLDNNSLPVYLRTILINSKAFREEEDLKEMLIEIENLLSRKIGKVY